MENSIDPHKQFQLESENSIKTYHQNEKWCKLSNEWMIEAFKNRYMYNFRFLGRPIIQTPAEIVAIQELIWLVKPDLIIETGIAHGGSLILSAGMLALIDYCEAIESRNILDPFASRRKVIGLDIDIRDHNQKAIIAHPMAHKIKMIQGSSIDPNIVEQVNEIASSYKKILVCLDSNHTHDHVLAELESYAPLTSKGSYCVVLDSIVEDLPKDFFPDRPWNVGDNPKTAVWEYLKRIKSEGRIAKDGDPLSFEIDKMIDEKLMITVAPDGFLKRI